MTKTAAKPPHVEEGEQVRSGTGGLKALGEQLNSAVEDAVSQVKDGKDAGAKPASPEPPAGEPTRLADGSTLPPGEKVGLTPKAFHAASELLKLGAYGKHVEVPREVRQTFDAGSLQELDRKNLIENVGGGPGRAGRIKLFVRDDQIEERTSGRGFTASPSGRRGERHDALAGVERVGGKWLVSDDDIRQIQERLLEYIAEVSPKAQQEWHLRKSKATSPAQLARLAAQWEKEGVSDEVAAQRMEDVLKQRHLTFPDYLEGKYGKTMVKVLGIPNVVDTPDDRRPRSAA